MSTTEVDRTNLSEITPPEVIDQLIGSRITVLMNYTKTEYTGILRGFDDYVNLVLEDAVETSLTADGPIVTQLNEIFLNNARIAVIFPTPTSE